MQGISVANKNELDVTTTFFPFLFSSNEQTQNPHEKDRNAIGCTYLAGGNEIVFEENAKHEAGVNIKWA